MIASAAARTGTFPADCPQRRPSAWTGPRRSSNPLTTRPPCAAPGCCPGASTVGSSMMWSPPRARIRRSRRFSGLTLAGERPSWPARGLLPSAAEPRSAARFPPELRRRPGEGDRQASSRPRSLARRSWSAVAAVDADGNVAAAPCYPSAGHPPVPLRPRPVWNYLDAVDRRAGSASRARSEILHCPVPRATKADRDQQPATARCRSKSDTANRDEVTSGNARRRRRSNLGRAPVLTASSEDVARSA